MSTWIQALTRRHETPLDQPSVATERPRPQPVPAPESDPLVQISFAARFSTRKRMFKVARDQDVTLKALILSALQAKYPTLGIEAADLIDLRAKR